MTSAPDQTSADNRLEFLFLLLSLGNISSWNFRIFQFWQMKFSSNSFSFFLFLRGIGREREGEITWSFTFFLSFFLFIYEIKNEIENTKIFPRTITVEMSQKLTPKISFFKLP